MERTYYCPKCKATLNPNVKIILVLVNGPRRGLMLANQQPGNYEAILTDDLGVKEGDIVDFHCPVCMADLRADVDPNLAKIYFRDPDGTKGRVNFSRRFGEQATFLVTKEKIQSYGDNAEAYNNLNFFGAGTFDED